MGNRKFMIWSNEYEEGYCVIESPEGVDDDEYLNQGLSWVKDWPSGVVCRMNDDYPKDIQLSDNLYGTDLIIISEKVKDFLGFEQVNNIEFLPLAILNHKERVASDAFFIVNPIGVIDCIDLEISKVEWNDIESDLIDRCELLAFKDESLPKEEMIFRAKYLPDFILIRTDLTQKLKGAGFSGFEFKDPINFTGF